MNKKKVWGCLSALLMVSSFFFTHASAQQREEWIEIHADRFDRVEAFFLDNGCEFYQNAAFIYDSGSARFISKAEVKEVLPADADLFMEHGCSIEVSPKALSRVLSYNKRIPENTKVILFFDLAVAQDGSSVINMLSDDLKSAYKARLAGLSKIHKFEKYKVVTSLTGYNQ